MNNDLTILFSNISSFLWILIVLACLYKYKSIYKGGLIFLLLPLAMAVAETSSLVYKGVYENLFYNIYTYVEVIISITVLNYLQKKKLNRSFLIILITIYSFVFITEFWINHFTKMIYHSMILSSFIETGIGIYTLYDLLENSEEILVLESPSFWIGTSFIVYNVGTTMIFLVIKKLHLLNPTAASLYFEWINSVFNFLFVLFYAIGILCLKVKNPFLPSSRTEP